MYLLIKENQIKKMKCKTNSVNLKARLKGSWASVALGTTEFRLNGRTSATRICFKPLHML